VRITPLDSYIIYTDGAALGNPGPAGAGAIVVDPKGNIVYRISESLGIASNNEAEYYAIILALEKAANMDFQDIEIRSDSQLIVRQINGQYKVKSPNLKPLFKKVLNLLSNFQRTKMIHISREFNKEADKLAKLGAKRVKVI